MVSGRGFTKDDDSRAEPVTVINRAMAERYGRIRPIDRVQVTAGFDSDAWFRIVGVVEDVPRRAEPRSALEIRPYSQGCAHIHRRDQGHR